MVTPPARPPKRLAHATVVLSIPCRQCRYDLRGLPVSGRCPECGTDVWGSVEQFIDPMASRLPRLHNPRVVGNAIFYLAVSWCLAVALWVLPPIVLWLDRLSPPHNLDVGDLWVRVLRGLSPLIILSSLWSVWKLRPPSGAVEAEVRRHVTALAVGIVLGAIALAMVIQFDQLNFAPQSLIAFRLVVLAGAILGFIALKRILLVVGERSREYRTSHTGRQSLSGLMVVLGLIGLGRLVQLIELRDWPRPDYAIDFGRLGELVVVLAFLMLLIGLVYLVVNAWWIRRSLRNQPPSLLEVVGRGAFVPAARRTHGSPNDHAEE